MTCWSSWVYSLLGFFFVWVYFANAFVLDGSEAQSNCFCFFFSRLLVVSLYLYLSTDFGIKAGNVMLCFCSLAVVSSVAQSLIDLPDFFLYLLLIAFPRLLFLYLALHLLLSSILAIDIH